MRFTSLLFLAKIALFSFWVAQPQSGTCVPVTPISFTTSYSQASQDQFVYTLLYEFFQKQDVGYYLEIGAGHPTNNNNTFYFEKNLGWHGLSLDIDPRIYQEWYSSRSNDLFIEDATNSNYLEMLKAFPPVIDYLSLDIDGNYDIVLRKIPFDRHIFKIITIEHDFYRLGDQFRKNEREILSSMGYYLLCPDVMLFYNGKDSIFEDWWIYPNAFPADLLSILLSLDLKTKLHEQIIATLHEVIKITKKI